MIGGPSRLSRNGWEMRRLLHGVPSQGSSCYSTVPKNAYSPWPLTWWVGHTLRWLALWLGEPWSRHVLTSLSRIYMRGTRGTFSPTVRPLSLHEKPCDPLCIMSFYLYRLLYIRPAECFEHVSHLPCLRTSWRAICTSLYILLYRRRK